MRNTKVKISESYKMAVKKSASDFRAVAVWKRNSSVVYARIRMVIRDSGSKIEAKVSNVDESARR